MFNPLLLDAIFAALADPTRRSILERLRHGEASVGELAEPLTMSLPAVSKHLRILEEAGLLSRRVEGRNHYIKANAEPLEQAVNWIERQREFWKGSFERLEKLFQEPKSPTPPKTTSNKKLKSS